MENPGILYPYAKDENGNRVEAGTLTKEEASLHQYRCPQCNEKMIPVLKNVGRVKHFRHLGTQCRYNDYLHTYAEDIFLAEYQRCLDKGFPFYLEYAVPVRCNHSCVLKEHQDCKERFNTVTTDLTEEYTLIQREARVRTEGETSRIPDILLSSEDGSKSLWVEICVTHEVPLEKQSQGRIIEVKISSLDDLSMFREHRIRQCSDKERWVRLYGIGNVLVDAPMQNTPPCDMFYVYEVAEEHVWGQGRIVASIPKTAEGLQYRAALRLNWHKSHDGEGCPFPPRTKEELSYACYKKYSSGKTDDVLLYSLYVDGEEYRKHAVSLPADPPTLFQKRFTTPSRKASPAPAPQPQQPATVNWIDLGLPSGTRWADCNGTPVEAQDAVSLPTRKDIEELKHHCKQSISEDGSHLILTGPNENTLTLEGGKYLLNDRERDFVYCLNIYAPTDNDYLRIIDEDPWVKTSKRFIKH